GRPVHAFALPEFATIARATPPRTRSMHSRTGAAHTWFVVNMPATAAGPSQTISARSRLAPFSEPRPVPSRLMSQNTPAARKPRGARMEAETGTSFGLMSGWRTLHSLGAVHLGSCYNYDA